ncbi:MAG TPA: YihY/virulence factor BrkB family protein [Streptosporangiaceae bacterium]
MHSEKRAKDQAKELAGQGKRWVAAVDRAQQRRPWLAVAIATWKKFGDDQAGNLAALVAYFAFASIFPLLLILVTVLDIVLKDNPSVRAHLLNSALSQYPGVGMTIRQSVTHGMSQTGLALVIGVILTLFGARGIATAMQNAMNAVWGIPRFRRPKFLPQLGRSFALIGVLGPGLIITISLSSIAGGTGGLGAAGARVAAIAVSLLLNVGLFWLGFRLATAAEIRGRDLWLSAILAAIVWQILQVLGGYFVAHQLRTNSAYGTFGVVLGLLAWFYLEAQVTLYVVELNVVRVRRLWPRSVAPPPLTEGDMRAYELYAEASRRRPEVDVGVSKSRDRGYTAL